MPIPSTLLAPDVTTKSLSRLVVKATVLFALILTGGCKEDERIQDQEMKGVLTVDKAAYGNAYLEAKDGLTNQTRFIHPGKKIISILRDGKALRIEIMDGRRVTLAAFKVSIKNLAKENYTKDRLFLKNNELNQPWDLEIIARKFPIATDLIATRASKACAGGQLRGKLWRVFDYRNYYEVRFLVPHSQTVWGRLVADGEMHTEAAMYKYDKCTAVHVQHTEYKEIYQ